MTPRKAPDVAAFFCESASGCGGQVFLPDGYLTAAFAAVRAAGGVCVADEVQTGFGRAGSHFWMFETQGAVPDIVTIVGWHSCEHLAPVHEGDTLYSELELERVDALSNGGALAHLRSRVVALGEHGDDDGGTPVLDWRFVAVVT